MISTTLALSNWERTDLIFFSSEPEAPLVMAMISTTLALSNWERTDLTWVNSDGISASVIIFLERECTIPLVERLMISLNSLVTDSNGKSSMETEDIRTVDGKMADGRMDSGVCWVIFWM